MLISKVGKDYLVHLSQKELEVIAALLGGVSGGGETREIVQQMYDKMPKVYFDQYFKVEEFGIMTKE